MKGKSWVIRFQTVLGQQRLTGVIVFFVPPYLCPLGHIFLGVVVLGTCNPRIICTEGHLILGLQVPRTHDSITLSLPLE